MGYRGHRCIVKGYARIKSVLRGVCCVLVGSFEACPRSRHWRWHDRKPVCEMQSGSVISFSLHGLLSKPSPWLAADWFKRAFAVRLHGSATSGISDFVVACFPRRTAASFY